MKQLIQQRFLDSIETKKLTLEKCHSNIVAAGELLADTLKNGNKVLMCGNGGSASDAQHFSAELIMRYETERASLPAIALTTDSSVLTAIGNDLDFAKIFERQIMGLGNKDDLLIGISTSGNSQNIINAIKVAQKKSMNILILTGKNGGEICRLLNSTDCAVIVPSDITGRIQESHILIIHCLCEIIDQLWKS